MLPNGLCFISDSQDYFDCVIKQHETLINNPPMQIYVNRQQTRASVRRNNETIRKHSETNRKK